MVTGGLNKDREEEVGKGNGKGVGKKSRCDENGGIKNGEMKAASQQQQRQSLQQQQSQQQKQSQQQQHSQQHQKMLQQKQSKQLQQSKQQQEQQHRNKRKEESGNDGRVNKNAKRKPSGRDKSPPI